MARAQIATTLIAALLALVAGAVILGVSPMGIGQTITVYPGSSTKIVNTINIQQGMLINITNSTCVITDPAYAVTAVSPMEAEGSDVFSPYSNCLPLGIDLGYIGSVSTNLTLGNSSAGEYNNSFFIMENGLLKFVFSPADTMRIFINETGNFTQLLRLGWVTQFISDQKWDNLTSAKFLDEENVTKIQMNLSTTDGYLIHNVSMHDYSPSLGFSYQWYDTNTSKNSSMYPSWYPEEYFNISHPNYTWPQAVRYFDSIRLMATDEVFIANQSVAFCNAEIWDSTRNLTKFTITVDNACGAVWHAAEAYDSTIEKFEIIHLEDRYIDKNITQNNARQYSFTIIPDQTQTCIGAGTFNMTCEFVPIREGNHTVEMYMDYYYVNQSSGSNSTEFLTKSDWFWVESAPAPGCDTGPTCDTPCNWLLGHTCDCNEECASGYCSNGVCYPSNYAPPFVPPAKLIPNFTVSYPNKVSLYFNQSRSFTISVQNTGDVDLNQILLFASPSEIETRILPTLYKKLYKGESKVFLVSMKSEYLINDTIEFYVKTNETPARAFNISILVGDAPIEINDSIVIEQVNNTGKLWNETREIILLLSELGYDTTDLAFRLYGISEMVEELQNIIESGDLVYATDQMSRINLEIEAIFIEMGLLTPKEDELWAPFSYITSLIFGISIALMICLLIVRTYNVVLLTNVLSIATVVVITYVFFAMGLVDYRFLFIGAVLGVSLFMVLKSYLGITQRLFKSQETFKIFLFTIIYFIASGAALVSIVSVGAIFVDVTIPPLDVILGLSQPYSEIVVEVHRNMVTIPPMQLPSNTVPEDAVFLMTLWVDTNETGTITDYFPREFSVADRNGGIILSYNNEYNKIVWQGSVGSYTLVSPAYMDKTYHFGRAEFNNHSEAAAYPVSKAPPMGSLIDVNMKVSSKSVAENGTFQIELHLDQVDPGNGSSQIWLTYNRNKGLLDKTSYSITDTCEGAFEVVDVEALCTDMDCTEDSVGVTIDYTMEAGSGVIIWTLKPCDIGTYAIASYGTGINLDLDNFVDDISVYTSNPSEVYRYSRCIDLTGSSARSFIQAESAQPKGWYKRIVSNLEPFMIGGPARISEFLCNWTVDFDVEPDLKPTVHGKDLADTAVSETLITPWFNISAYNTTFGLESYYTSPVTQRVTYRLFNSKDADVSYVIVSTPGELRWIESYSLSGELEIREKPTLLMETADFMQHWEQDTTGPIYLIKNNLQNSEIEMLDPSVIPDDDETVYIYEINHPAGTWKYIQYETNNAPSKIISIDPAGASWWNSTFRYRRMINVTNYLSENLTEYQVLINLTTSNFNYAHAEPAGLDLRFTYYNESEDADQEMMFFLDIWNTTGDSWIWAQLPLIPANGNATMIMYYGNTTPVGSISNYTETFSYSERTATHYIVDNAQIDDNILYVASYADGNEITVDGSPVLNLDERGTGEFAASELFPYSNISSLKPFSTASNWSDVATTTAPISFAGTQFITYNQRVSNMSLNFVAPFEIANVTVCLGTTNCQSYEVEKDSFGERHGLTSGATAYHIFSNVSILVARGSTTTEKDDTFPMQAVVSEQGNATEWWGVASQRWHYCALESGTYIYYLSSGDTGTPTSIGPINAFACARTTANLGSQGSAPAFHFWSNKPIEVHQQADSDGTEGSTFFREIDLDYDFVIPIDSQYIAVATRYNNTNCTLYYQNGSVLETLLASSAYDYPQPGQILFGASYAGAELKCDKPVAIYFETVGGNAESNVFGPKANRKYAKTLPTYDMFAEEESVGIRAEGTFLSNPDIYKGESVVWQANCTETIGSEDLDDVFAVLYDNSSGIWDLTPTSDTDVYTNVSMYYIGTVTAGTTSANYLFDVATVTEGAYLFRTFCNSSVTSYNSTAVELGVKPLPPYMDINMTIPQSDTIVKINVGDSIEQTCNVSCYDNDCSDVEVAVQQNITGDWEAITLSGSLYTNQSEVNLGVVSQDNSETATWEVTGGASSLYWIRCNVTSSDAMSNATVPAGLDVNAYPTVVWDYPSDNEWLHGVETLDASSSSDSDGTILFVEFWEDADAGYGSTVLVCNDTSGPTFTCSWDTDADTECSGDITCYLRAIAYDDDSATDSADTYVRKDNTAPTTTVDHPKNDTYLIIESQEVNATADDGTGSGISCVEFYANYDSSWSELTLDCIAPYGYTWSLASVSDQVIEVRARANDTETNLGGWDPHGNITHDTTDPSVVLDEPSGSDMVNVTPYTLDSSSSSDATAGVAECRWYRSPAGLGTWTLIGQDTDPVSGWTYSWSIGISDGSYDIKTNCTDKAGFWAEDSASSVTIDVQNQNPSCTVVYPNGYENISGTVFVSATASEPDPSDWVSNVTFEYSYNLADWTTIGTNLSEGLSSYTYSWDTSALTESDEYNINCTAEDRRDGTGSDLSNANFTVDNTKTLISEEYVNESAIGINKPVCINATVTDNFDVSVVFAELYVPGSVDKNVTLLDDGNGCDISAGDNEYSAVYICSYSGEYNLTKIWANDTAGNMNDTSPIKKWSVTSLATMTTLMEHPGVDREINETATNNQFKMNCTTSCDAGGNDCTDVLLHAQYLKGSWKDITTGTTDLVNDANDYSCGTLTAGGTHCSHNFTITAGTNSGNNAWDIICMASSSNAPNAESNSVVLTINDKPTPIFAYPADISWLHGTENLDGSSSTDKDGTVSLYSFEIDDNAAFSSPTTICSGASATCNLNTQTQSECAQNNMNCYLRLNNTDNDGLWNDTVINVGVDNTVPTTTLGNPANDTYIPDETKTVDATADDGTGSGISCIEFQANYDSSWNEITLDCESPYSYEWDLSSVSDQVIEVRARANDTETNLGEWDPHGNITHDTTVPSCSLTTPSNGQRVYSSFDLTGTYSDTTAGIGNVTYTFNNGSWYDISSVGSAPYSYSWDTTDTYDSIGVEVRATCYDVPGHSSFSSSTDVRINNNPPQVSGTQPNDTTVSASEPICFSATMTSPGASFDEMWCQITDADGGVTNYTLTDTGCGGSVDDIYEVEIVMDKGGVWWINSSFANDSDSLYGEESPHPETAVTVTSHLYISTVPPVPTLEGFGHNVSIRADVVGDLSIQTVLANVSDPQGWEWLEMELETGDTYFVNFTDTWDNGQYEVYVWANMSDTFSNDTSGDAENFEIRGNATFNMSVSGDSYVNNENVTIMGAGWWDSSWKYRKPINISERSNTAMGEYPVLLFIDTETLISAGKMNSDCSDMRFVNESNIEAPYFIDFGYIDCDQPNTTVWVQVPLLKANQNNTIYIYYGRGDASSQSDEMAVFTYSTLATTAYAGDNRTTANDINITSYVANNQIYDGTTTLNLGQGESDGFPSSELSTNTAIQSLGPYSSTATGSSDGDTVMPVSFAGTKFIKYCRRGTCDFDVVSPFGIADVTVCTGTGGCTTQVIDTGGYYDFMGFATSNTTIHIYSNISILAHTGTEDGNEDFFALIPIYGEMVNYTRKDGNWTYWGVPSARLHNAAGPDAANILCYRSLGSVYPLSLAAWSVDAQTGLGTAGAAAAYMCTSFDIFYTVQEADGDGTESTSFLPEYLLDYEFFLPADAEYVAIGTKQGTNCTVYDGSGVYVTSAASTGSGGYPYPGQILFNTAGQQQRDYRIVCNNSVIPYFERSLSNGETNLYGPKANMKYIEPMPWPYGEGGEEIAPATLNVTNIGALNMSVYLLMQIQTNLTGTWEVVTTQVNDTTPRTITFDEIVNLTEVFGNWNTTSSDGGDYRVYAALLDPYGNTLLNNTGEGINTTAYFTIAETVFIDGDFTTPIEWSTTGSCGDNDWLISDPDDVAPDTSDIEIVYSQSGGTYMYVAVQFRTDNGIENTTVWFDNPTYDGTDDYNVTIQPSFAGITVWDLSTNTPTNYNNDGTKYIGHDTGTNLTEFRIPKSAIGSPLATKVYVTTDLDRANDTGYLEHDFTSCTGPSAPIPEFPFGAIIALLLPLLIFVFSKNKIRFGD